MRQPATMHPAAAFTMASAEAVPWPLWCFVAATLSSVAGVLWDISWHKSIGRDTFWSPPHILIYACGILAGIGSAALILPGREPASVRVWGFRGPLGAFIAAWGGITMLSSAPFDDWWHNAYGLDVKILSPPHVVLGVGLLAIRLGTLLLVMQQLNRTSGQLQLRMRALFVIVGAVWLTGALGMFQEITVRIFHHTGRFYMVVAPIAVLTLTAMQRAWPKGRWMATATASVTAAVGLAQLWILPLFPAEPMLGPVYQKVTHFIPNEFPFLLPFPAIVLDVLRRRGGSPWIAGPLFVAVFVALQWPFATFLNSPASRNWIFGAHYLPYLTPTSSDYARAVFATVETPAELWVRMGLAVAGSVAAAWLGGRLGAWLSRLRR